MDIQQLRCFLAVAEELHFGRAAERLHMTASPVSRTVRDLERELGADLFVRGYHQIELTPAGRELAVRVPPLLVAFDRLRSEIQLVAAGEERVVRLGGSHLSPPGVLDAVVECAEKGNPGRRVDVTLAPSAELLPPLGRGELDAAVVHLPVAEPGMMSVGLAEYHFMVAMRRDDPLAGRSELAIADLADRTVVTYPLALQPLAMQGLRDDLVSRGLRHFHLLAGADAAMLAGHVRRTGDLTFTLAPHTGGSARIFDDPAFALVPVIDGPPFRLGLVWLADRATDRVVAGLVDAVRERWSRGEWEI
ncbi:LysR family transcriptional regulator [Paractinoplanes globisporus]|uniref:LysR family transcriptional regulator n=1 Tax=Paractinoplanes globisporus TaxID=113565 RepID=A0ABW6WA69_9ACTN|nr:LysR family transcriptional regulator [Actinoplanes globisporus]